MVIKELTTAEEKIMMQLWKLEKGFVKEILNRMVTPKPAYNTVSTIVRILEKKGFVGYESFGGTCRYYPLISKTNYTRFITQKLLDKYFDGSTKELMIFTINKLKTTPISLGNRKFSTELNE